MTWILIAAVVLLGLLFFIAARGQRRRSGDYTIDQARSAAMKHQSTG
jgi:hypothetical protein